MQPSSYWRLHQKSSLQEIEALLPRDYRLHTLDSVNQQLTLLDSYDWDIWQRGMLLFRNGKQELRLLQQDNRCLATCATTEEQRFWWQLPAGELANRLKELVSVRAFTPKHKALLVTEQIVVRNEDSKIVVRTTRVRIETPEQTAQFLKLTPLQGYQREYQQTITALVTLNLKPVSDFGLQSLLQETGLEVNPPQSKAIFKLQAQETAETAVTRMAATMIQLARQQEQGIIADIDTEFVHHYRVNIRKTRSLISLFKKTLSAQRLQQLKSSLKTIASQTNELRDLDVFLLDQDFYRHLLPQHLWPGLEQLFHRIKRRRVHALQKVVCQLNSDTYLEQLNHLFLTLQQAPDLQTKQAQAEIKQLAGKKILAQYRLIQADGRGIGADTPDDAIHELRIEGKKLRYLLELFRELFAKETIRRLIKYLKGLQDNLGNFNDYSVQQQFLLQFAQGKNISAEQLASINGLAAVLYHKQSVERGLVVQNINEFINQEVENLFQELFHPAPEGIKP
ncbi:CHAD domain-containing protein [Desulfuromusa kysingii]|uniref:CHAD domain-containing protein n=1 Tax=Desulfuromusa kysingii TaxID=37625 RepID=A0A1H3ZT85_9BACT|nr:CHAD domain-containing protein [Desulfuromusa kysingii]SEA26474.1 CHAD domain-containing protein [Desulfuromusa kysingii]